MKEVLKQIDEKTEKCTVEELDFVIKFLKNKIEYLDILKDFKEVDIEEEGSTWKKNIIQAS